MDEEETEKTVKDILIPRGKGCGEKIAEVIRGRGYDTVIPLYRSAVAIEVKKDPENDVPHVSIKSFDDPHWMGAEEISEETVGEGCEYLIKGTRSGAVFYDLFQEKLDGKGKLLTEHRVEEKRKIDEKVEESDSE